MNLNSDIYKRFNLKIELDEVREGFCTFSSDLFLDKFAPIVHPDMYKDTSELYKIQSAVFKDACRQTFEDYSRFGAMGVEVFISTIFSKHNFLKTVINLQILLNIIYTHKLIEYELQDFCKSLSSYLDDYPMLGLTLKIYKTKSPQILPTISKYHNDKISITLGLLEGKKFKSVLDSFEDGLKEFLLAKNNSQLKDVVEDMYTACDELAKVISGQKNKGFKHIFNKEDYKIFGFKNKNSKEIYSNLNSWMNDIKHGTIKDFDKNDVEMIISLIASFIRFVIIKNS
jgi:hypothetical protein